MQNNNIDTNDPDNWKLGIFYFNKNDKRLFPPKRERFLGWTINFAIPWSIISFFVLIFCVYFFIIYFI